MIRIKNDTRSFVEKDEGQIIIYTAGNAGFWTGYYLKRCGIDFLGYVDKTAPADGAFYNDKPLWQPQKLQKYGGGGQK